MAARFFLLCFLSISTWLSCQKEYKSFNLFENHLPCTIVVDLGPFADAASAVQSGENGDPEAREARTRAWAAIELRYHLAGMSALSESSLAILDDERELSGNLIFIGLPGKKSAYNGVRTELQKRWKKIKDAKPGTVRIDALQDDRGNNILALSGDSAAGTLSAVYEWLDALGVRWLAPGKTNTLIPLKSRIAVPAIGYFREPAIPGRGFLPACMENSTQAARADVLDWMARQRVEMCPAAGETCDDLHLRGLKAIRSIAIQPASAEGFCISKDESVTGAVNQLLAEFAAHPGTDVIVCDLSRMSWCSCAACSQRGNICDKSLFLLSQMGQALKQKIGEHQLPGTAMILGILALQTPQQFIQRAWPKEVVHLCLRIQPRCYDHALSDPACVEVNAPAMRCLAAWSQLQQFGPLGVVEGYQAPEFWRLPLVLSTRIQEDAVIYSSLGFQGWWTEMPDFAGGLRAWTNYQSLRFAWKADQPEDSLFQEFMAGYYAGAQPVMQEYARMIEEAFGNIAAWRMELPQRLNRISQDEFRQPLFPMDHFEKHFNLSRDLTEPAIGTDWERSYQLIHDAQHVMDEALAMALPDQTVDHLLAADQELKYAEMNILLYDNLIRVFTLGEEEPEMREEAAIRLREVANKMAAIPVPGHPCQAANALAAAGVEEVVIKVSAELDRRYGKKYARMYE
jgi:hypothetical protein